MEARQQALERLNALEDRALAQERVARDQENKKALQAQQAQQAKQAQLAQTQNTKQPTFSLFYFASSPKRSP
jgi:hypothetical protein